jgi:uncharacterized protein (TIGR04255 family)
MPHSPTMDKGFPDYENPPVIEVVCGILFKPLTAFLSPYIGLLWEKYKSGYPQCSEVAPLDPMIERFDEPPHMMLEIGSIPPLPRIWFLQEQGHGIIQVQRDRFLHNWRKVNPKDEYPRYRVVKQMFMQNLSKFQAFLDENKLGSIEPLQYEMTYVNHIPQGEGWENLGDIGHVLPDFAFAAKKNRFVPEPNTVNWRTTFVLPEKAARMHMVVRNVRQRDTGRLILLFELTVRGIGKDKSFEGMSKWFDLARQWIVCGFADLTSHEVQEKIWKRKR